MTKMTRRRVLQQSTKCVAAFAGISAGSRIASGEPSKLVMNPMIHTAGVAVGGSEERTTTWARPVSLVRTRAASPQLGIGQLKLEGPKHFTGVKKPGVVEKWSS